MKHKVESRLPGEISVQFSCSVMSDSATPCTTACQASLSLTNSQSLLKLIELVMPSNHLILCHPLLLKIAGRSINNLKYIDNITLVAESEEELKSLLMKVKEESKKVGLIVNIQKTKIMASGPITSWQIDGETIETVTGSFWWGGGSKITADGDCSHEIKRCLLLGRKAMTNLDSMLKSKHYFTNKGPSSQSYGFSTSHVWM